MSDELKLQVAVTNLKTALASIEEARSYATAALVDLEALTPHEPPWLTVARGELGIRELPGPEHTARVLEYLSTLDNIGSWGKGRDETPWCSGFVNWCLDKAGGRGTRHGLASSWMDWGDTVESGGLEPGDILVWPHHVSFYPGGLGWASLGGNQDNSVSIKVYTAAPTSIRRVP